MKNTLHWGSLPYYVRHGHPKDYCKCKPIFVKKGLFCDPCNERKRRESGVKEWWKKPVKEEKE